ncbi:hypothetical protein VKT23_012427 [Stygiomarasmius scandens]|uniref:Extracellular serine-rich protein n=1 Tax=Marasmiellus scandens TaxID=2682957 RepID=A0ABR1J647_9AGAR
MRYISSVLFTSGLAVLVRSETILVNVGQKSDGSLGFAFNPANFTAQQDDVVAFNFSAVGSNHSVTQSTFADPCKLMSGGFDSGFVSVSDDGTQGWNLTITNASAPIWFYCKQLNAPNNGAAHCIQGMVGAINAPTEGEKSFANFMSTAQATSGEPDQGGDQNLNGVGASAASAPGPIPTDGSGAPSDNGNSSDPGNGGNSDGNSGGDGGGALGLGVNIMFGAAALLIGFTLA